MVLRHVPVARIAAVLGVGVALVIVLGHAGGPRWKTLRPGAEFTTFHGEPYCRHGSAEIAVLRIDPARANIEMHHFSTLPDGRPPSIVEWQQRTGALAVFNAGQYYADYSYMGLLVSGGRTISSQPHPAFKAALVASPVNGGPRARVLDLARDSLDLAHPQWNEVAQSFMLFDRSGALRVRKSDHIANRTAVAEDRGGRLLVITSEGAYTLWEFARLLQQAPFGIIQAMSMDGGFEAELCVRSGPFRYASFGRWDDDADVEDAPGAHVPLPAVVAVKLP